MKPQNKNELGLGVIRRSNGKTNTIVLVANHGLVHGDFVKAAQKHGIEKNKYWVFAYSELNEDKSGNEFSLGLVGSSGFGFDDFVEAQEKYLSLADSLAGVKNKTKILVGKYLWG